MASEPLALRANRIFAQNLLVKMRRAHNQLTPAVIPICDALLQAGYETATSAVAVEPLKTLWQMGDGSKASGLAQVFTMSVLSRYLALPRQGRESDAGAPEQERRDWIRFMIDVFGDDRRNLDYYLGLDKQHQVDQNTEQRRIQRLADVLFFVEALRALGSEIAMRIEASDLPMSEYTPAGLAERGVRFLTAGVHEGLVQTITSVFYATVMPRVDWRM